jgi:hypothetical protein
MGGEEASLNEEGESGEGNAPEADSVFAGPAASGEVSSSLSWESEEGSDSVWMEDSESSGGTTERPPVGTGTGDSEADDGRIECDDFRDCSTGGIAGISRRGRRGSGRKWTPEEDDLLRASVQIHGRRNWKAVARGFPGRSPVHCRQRWVYHVGPKVDDAPWSVEEDKILRRARRRCKNEWGRIGRSLPTRGIAAIKTRWNELVRLDAEAELEGLWPAEARDSRRPWTRVEDDLLRESVGVHRVSDWTAVASGVPGRNSQQCRQRWVYYLCPKADDAAWSVEEDELLRREHHRHGNRGRRIAMSLPRRGIEAIKARWNELVRLDGRAESELVSTDAARVPFVPWTSEEDNLLRETVLAEDSGPLRWRRVAEHVPGRSAGACSCRWFEKLRPRLVVAEQSAESPSSSASAVGAQRGWARWTQEEDCRLVQGVGLYGTGRWGEVSDVVPGRSEGACATRWASHIAGTLRDRDWSAEEDAALVAEHKARGDRFDLIRESLPDGGVDEVPLPHIFLNGRAYEGDVILARWDSIMRGRSPAESGSSSGRPE